MTGAGRFAPSPTSHLHLGNLRTALAAWLLARSTGRRFVLRVEDLDQVRSRAAAGVADQQLRDLERLGLDWDGEVMRQSERSEAYREAVGRLDTYRCFCSRRDIALASRAPNGPQDWRPYPGTCRGLSVEEADEKARDKAAALRLRAPVDHWPVRDLARGWAVGPVDDVVVVRRDQMASYNLAVVVDDAAQGVDQVVRARDLWPSSPRQALLGHLLGLDPVLHAHTGLVTDPGGTRLSKSLGAAGLADLAPVGLTTSRVVALLAVSLGLPGAASPAELLAAVPNPWLPPGRSVPPPEPPEPLVPPGPPMPTQPPGPPGPHGATGPTRPTGGGLPVLSDDPWPAAGGWWSDWVAPQDPDCAKRMSMT